MSLNELNGFSLKTFIRYLILKLVYHAFWEIFLNKRNVKKLTFVGHYCLGEKFVVNKDTLHSIHVYKC